MVINIQVSLKCHAEFNSSAFAFLIYVNDKKQVLPDVLLYGYDSCLVFQHKHVTKV